VQNVDFSDTLIEQKNNTNQRKKKNKTNDARNKGSQQKKRRMREQRKLNGFENSLGSNAKSFINFLLFSKNDQISLNL
jgi:hypothetical protein